MTIIFYFPKYERLAKNMARQTGFELGDVVIRNFIEGETYVKINSEVKDKKVILICGLEDANSKIMALMFFAKTARELGALEVGLVAPYLGYMRMDKRFNLGEAITSNIFAEFLSKQIDWLVTVDPHLHRHKNLAEIYTIPCKTLHATKPIADWIKANVKNPLLIGPDEESQQWVAEIAAAIKAPFLILNKVRYSERQVEVSIPEIANYKDHVAVVIDDIISTAQTMIQAIKHLREAGAGKSLAIGVHAIFAGDAFADLKSSGVEKIVTCNTISHASNAIDLDDLIINQVIQL